MDFQDWLIILVIFFSFIVRNVFGFGAALIAIPLFALNIGVRASAPFVAALAIINALLILIKDWNSAKIKMAWLFLIYSLPGIPLGLFLLKEGNETLIKIFLGIALLTYSSFSLFYKGTISLTNDRRIWLFSFFAGLLGGACNTSGPPVILYGILRHWPPLVFRATLQGFFFPSTLIIIIGHFYAGLWNDATLRYFIISLPAMLLSFFPSHWLLRKISPDKYQKYLYILLCLMGATLLVQSIFKRNGVI